MIVYSIDLLDEFESEFVQFLELVFVHLILVSFPSLSCLSGHHF